MSEQKIFTNEDIDTPENNNDDKISKNNDNEEELNYNKNEENDEDNNYDNIEENDVNNNDNIQNEDKKQCEEENNNDQNEGGEKLYYNEEEVSNNININQNEQSNNEENDKEEEKKNEEEDENQEEYILIQTIEDFHLEVLNFPLLDLLYFIKQNNKKFPKSRLCEMLKTIDTNNDGLISLIDTISFLLHNFKYRSTKLTLKYLYIIIYNVEKNNSVEDFIIENNLELYQEIELNDLCNLLLKYSIESPISKAIYNEMKVIFNDPITYKQLCELIDKYKIDNVVYIHTDFTSTTNRDNEDNNNFNKNKDKDNFAFLKMSNLININNTSNKIDMEYFNESMKKIVNSLIDKNEDYLTTEYLKTKNMRKNLKKKLKKCENIMNLTQYNLNFSNVLNIEQSISLALFQLNKKMTPYGEKYVYLNDLIYFLESYIENDTIKIPEESYDIEKNKIIKITKVVELLEFSGPPLKFCFEKIPFATNGKISINEFKKYIYQFYPRIISPLYLSTLINHLDESNSGNISYKNLQLLLFEYSKYEKFSVILELEYMANQIIDRGKKKFKIDFLKMSSHDYFDKCGYLSKLYNDNDTNMITLEMHNIITHKLCTSDNNKKNLYEYLCKKTESSLGYNLNILIILLDQFFMNNINDNPNNYSATNSVNNSMIKYNETNNEIENRKIPKVEVVEKALNKLKVGINGKISICEFLLCVKNIKDRILLKDIVDKSQIGFVDFAPFIKCLRNVYNNKININYNLCAQYLYYNFIKSQDNIENFLIEKLNLEYNDDINKDNCKDEEEEENDENFDINKCYKTKEYIFSRLSDAFANDLILFNNFFDEYKFTNGKHKGLLGIKQLIKFITVNTIKNYKLKK